MARSISKPRQTSSTPPAVTDNEEEKEAQSSSPALPSHIVIARDEEDGLSFVQRLTGGPAGEGTVPPVYRQPPDSPNTMPPSLSSGTPDHISLLIARQLALYYYRGQAPLNNSPALDTIAPRGTVQTS